MTSCNTFWEIFRAGRCTVGATARNERGSRCTKKVDSPVKSTQKVDVSATFERRRHAQIETPHRQHNFIWPCQVPMFLLSNQRASRLSVLQQSGRHWLEWTYEPMLDRRLWQAADDGRVGLRPSLCAFLCWQTIMYTSASRKKVIHSRLAERITQNALASEGSWLKNYDSTTKQRYSISLFRLPVD